MQRLHRRHRETRRPARHDQGLAGQPAVERQDPLSAGPRRLGLHPGGDVQGRRRRRDVRATADHLSQESAIIVHGTVRADARAPGGFEIDVSGLEVVSAAHDYPITPKEHGVDFLMDRRHLWIRSARQQAILRVRHEVIDAVRDYFNNRGFILADTPIFTPSACEGTTTLFPVQYFDDSTAYLTQSGQLYNEANAMALGRVYCFGPTFRAEKSKTRRHLTEFWMVEPEVAYATLDDIIALAEGPRRRRRRPRPRPPAPRTRIQNSVRCRWVFELLGRGTWGRSSRRVRAPWRWPRCKAVRSA